MPIETRFKFRRLDEPEFKKLDYVVMGTAFEIQNEFGRLFNENIYKQEMKARLNERLECMTEEPVTISHKSFTKCLKMDLVVERSLICELKSVEHISPAHESQLVEYMMLCESTRGKIINFGSSSVQGKLISTNLTYEARTLLLFDTARWKDTDVESKDFKSLFVELLQDWGSGLRIDTYYSALQHLLGGPEKVIGTVEIQTLSQQVVYQKLHLLNPKTAFKISAITNKSAAFETQLQKFLDRTSLESIQWVNLDHQEIVFTTITKSN